MKKETAKSRRARDKREGVIVRKKEKGTMNERKIRSALANG